MRDANLQQPQQTNHSVTSTLSHTQPRAHQITRILLMSSVQLNVKKKDDLPLTGNQERLQIYYITSHVLFQD